MAQQILHELYSKQYAWVVFTGKTDIWWLRILKPNFRHCFVVIKDQDKWLSVDPTSPFLDIQIYHHLDKNFDLPQWLKSRGYVVLRSNINKNHKKAAPCMMFTCVEAVKRILGIHNRFIITPWQLYQFLKTSLNQNNKTQIKGDMSWAS